MSPEKSHRYGVSKQASTSDDIDVACESIRYLGYAVINGGYHAEWLEACGQAFEHAYNSAATAHGFDVLRGADEHNTVRLPMVHAPIFLDLASNERILAICRRMIADYVVLGQQNGVINPPKAARYNQGAWHRDLPYQHFTSSRPLALNALFCLDAFTTENGATKVLPASHLQELFPSEQFIQNRTTTVVAPAGSFIVLDCMTFHSGGVNTTELARRAVNHVYTIPHLRQQIDLPHALGENFTSDQSLRQLLGYGVRTPRSVSEFIQSRVKF